MECIKSSILTRSSLTLLSNPVLTVVIYGTLLLSSEFQYHLNILREVIQLVRFRAKIQIWCRFLGSILFLLPGHKSVYKSWKPLPNYFPSLLNQFIVLLELDNPTSSTIMSPRCHIIIMFTLIFQWVLNGDILSFWFEFLSILARQNFLPVLYCLHFFFMS